MIDIPKYHLNELEKGHLIKILMLHIDSKWPLYDDAVKYFTA